MVGNVKHTSAKYSLGLSSRVFKELYSVLVGASNIYQDCSVERERESEKKKGVKMCRRGKREKEKSKRKGKPYICFSHLGLFESFGNTNKLMVQKAESIKVPKQTTRLNQG